MKNQFQVPAWFMGIVTAWLLWVSKSLVDLQSEVAVLKYGVFKTVTSTESKKYNLDADMAIFKFFLPKK